MSRQHFVAGKGASAQAANQSCTYSEITVQHYAAQVLDYRTAAFLHHLSSKKYHYVKVWFECVGIAVLCWRQILCQMGFEIDLEALQRRFNQFYIWANNIMESQRSFQLNHHDWSGHF